MMTADVEPAELQYFDDIIAGFGATSDSQLHMPLIIQHLTRAYTTKAEVIQSANSILKTLILSHACFPFSSPVLLTKDAFCRAILLLTRRCEINFNQVEGTSSYDVIRERSKQKRLTFIYSALVRPPTGIPTHDDILDVVCRVRYPTGYYAKGVLRRRPISDFLPLAERLAPLEDKTLPDLLPVSFLQPLKSIVEAFLPRQDKPVDDLGFDRRDTLSAEQFMLWATKVCYILVYKYYETSPSHTNVSRSTCSKPWINCSVPSFVRYRH